VIALKAREFDRSHAVLELALEILNPGASLATDRAQFEVPLNGRPFASGVMALQAQVPAKGRQWLTMGLSLAYLDMPFAARSKIQRGEALLRDRLAPCVVRRCKRRSSRSSPLEPTRGCRSR
jgi:hypothetical protein